MQLPPKSHTNIVKAECSDKSETQFTNGSLPRRILYSENIVKAERGDQSKTQFTNEAPPSHILYSPNSVGCVPRPIKNNVSKSVPAEPPLSFLGRTVRLPPPVGPASEPESLYIKVTADKTTVSAIHCADRPKNPLRGGIPFCHSNLPIATTPPDHLGAGKNNRPPSRHTASQSQTCLVPLPRLLRGDPAIPSPARPFPRSPNRHNHTTL